MFRAFFCVFSSLRFVCVPAGCHRMTGSSYASLCCVALALPDVQSAPDRRDVTLLTIAFSAGPAAGAHCRPGRRPRFEPNRTSRTCRRLRRWIDRLNLKRRRLRLRHERHLSLVRRAIEGVHRAVTFGFFQSVDLIELYRAWLHKERPIGHVYVDTE